MVVICIVTMRKVLHSTIHSPPPPVFTPDLHSALVLSRKLDKTNPRKLREANKYYIIDAFLALMVAFVINLAVVATFANQFYDETCATESKLSACLGPGSVVINYHILMTWLLPLL